MVRRGYHPCRGAACSNCIISDSGLADTWEWPAVGRRALVPDWRVTLPRCLPVAHCHGRTDRASGCGSARRASENSWRYPGFGICRSRATYPDSADVPGEPRPRSARTTRPWFGFSDRDDAASALLTLPKTKNVVFGEHIYQQTLCGLREDGASEPKL